MEAYKHCFYDRNSGKIYLRTVADTKYQVFPYEKDYWVKDPTGQSKITDLYGVPMIRKTKFDKDAIKSLKANNIPVAESDLKEEVKFMHSMYDSIKLEADVNKWNFCFFDIEVAGSGIYEPNKICKIKLNDVEKEIQFEKLLPISKKYPNIEVYEESKNCWLPYNKSSFVSIEGFPYAEEAAVAINLITCYSSKTKQSYTWRTW